MGAYLRKPVTDKVSECGKFTVGSRKVLFGATAMQGWRIGMEDAHCIDSKFDDKSSLLAVYDGHGGREVAVYCAAHLGDIVKATKAYSNGDIGQALKDAFMKCDSIIVAEEAVKVMKQIVEDDMSKLHSNETEDIDTLIEEAHMPLNALLARYKGGGASNELENFENSRVGNTKEDGIKAVLQLVASQTGLELEFDNSDSDSDSQDENSDTDQIVGLQEDEEPSKHQPPVFSNISLESLLSSKPVSQPTLHSNGTLSLTTDKCKPEKQKNQKPERNKSEDVALSSDNYPINHATDIEVTSQSNNDQDLEHTCNSSDKTVERNTSGAAISDALDASQENKQDKQKTLPDVSELVSSSITGSSQLGSTPSDQHLSGTSPPNYIIQSSNRPSLSNIHSSSKPSLSHTPNQSLPCNNAQSSEVKVNREHGLMHLLTSAVETNASPLQEESPLHNSRPESGVIESQLNLPRKRPHPEDDSENDDVDHFVPKRREIMDDEGYHSGTTAVVAVLSEDMITVANAGDSRCVASLKGIAMDLSFDHKPTDLPELQRVEKAGGIVGPDGRVNGGLNLSRAIGDHFYKENNSLPLEEQMITAMPDIQTLAVTEEVEFVVLACDGIWNSKTSQEVIDFVRCRLSERTCDRPPTSDDLVEICESLCDACLAPDTDNDGTGCDNMTCIIALLSWS